MRKRFPEFLSNLISKTRIISGKKTATLRSRLSGDYFFKVTTAVVAFNVFIILGFIVYKIIEKSGLSLQTYGFGFLLGTTAKTL